MVRLSCSFGQSLWFMVRLSCLLVGVGCGGMSQRSSRVVSGSTRKLVSLVEYVADFVVIVPGRVPTARISEVDKLKTLYALSQTALARRKERAWRAPLPELKGGLQRLMETALHLSSSGSLAAQPAATVARCSTSLKAVAGERGALVAYEQTVGRSEYDTADTVGDLKRVRPAGANADAGAEKQIVWQCGRLSCRCRLPISLHINLGCCQCVSCPSPRVIHSTVCRALHTVAVQRAV